MRFSTLALLESVLVGAAFAMPLTGPASGILGWDTGVPLPGSSPNHTLVARGEAERNQCGDSLFVDGTTSDSPRLVDCAEIVYYLRSNLPSNDYLPFSLPLTTETAVGVIGRGNCGFGIRNAYPGPFHAEINIGRYDIADLLDSAIQKFGRNDQVGASGAMTCAPFNDGVYWAIYRF